MSADDELLQNARILASAYRYGTPVDDSIVDEFLAYGGPCLHPYWELMRSQNISTRQGEPARLFLERCLRCRQERKRVRT